MIYVNSYQHFLYTAIASDSVLVSSAFIVQKNRDYNTDPALIPWVGLYADSILISPHTFGGATPWIAHAKLLVYVQECSAVNMEDAVDRLFNALYPVLSVVNSNKSLGGYGDIITGITITPYQRNIAGNSIFAANEIELTLEARI